MSWNPFRRHRPTGRHTRPVYPSVPGAAATLVAVAAAAAGTAAPAPPPPLAAPPASQDASVPAVAPTALPAESVERPPRAGAVGLGFADGQAVELADDDPRAESLRTVAAALLDPGPR
jgi:hypothetical protein